MSFKRKGLLVSLEDIAEDVVVTELTDVDEFNTVYTDVVEDQDDLDVAFEALLELESYRSLLTEDKLSHTQARLLTIGLESINVRLGLQDPVPSLESYTGSSLSVSFEDQDSGIFKKIVDFITMIANKIMDFLKGIFTKVGRLKERAKKLLKESEKVSQFTYDKDTFSIESKKTNEELEFGDLPPSKALPTIVDSMVRMATVMSKASKFIDHYIYEIHKVPNAIQDPGPQLKSLNKDLLAVYEHSKESDEPGILIGGNQYITLELEDDVGSKDDRYLKVVLLKQDIEINSDVELPKNGKELVDGIDDLINILDKISKLKSEYSSVYETYKRINKQLLVFGIDMQTSQQFDPRKGFYKIATEVKKATKYINDQNTFAYVHIPKLMIKKCEVALDYYETSLKLLKTHNDIEKEAGANTSGHKGLALA